MQAQVQTKKGGMFVEIDVDAAILEEQNRDARKIEAEVGALGEVCKDVAQLVDDQGLELNKVEDHADQGERNVEQAAQILKEASGLACSARWKCFWIIVVALLILIILFCVAAVVIAVVVGVVKGKQ
eukprot:TRINITY_DN359_c0_g2_i1.p1 TRINITY_DN359_c0_g2~~TRINITY_DN359_c0_g2_i1.p1  ORF type:complete len:127 (-),score=23.21 TRINITY_DN359_c0_g2_i1:158-538(-)